LRDPAPERLRRGISTLEANAPDGSNFCVDFARSARSRSSSDPTCTSGGICYIYLAADAVDWAARSTAAGGTDAPASLTLPQLKAIYLCQTKNRDKVGGKNATIKPYLPQTSAGVRTVFLTALGGGTTPITPGSCVSDGATTQFPDGTIQQNEAQDPVLNSAQAIFPYSVADFIAQGYHDAACTSGCGGTVSDNPTCTPAGSQNQFGCNETTTGAGSAPVLALGEISKTKPTNVYPLPAEPTPPAINSTLKLNSGFDVSFQFPVFNVFRFGQSGSDPIPTYLQSIFDGTGFVCTSSAAQTAFKNYGFLALTGKCGTPLNGSG
jgi:hypothetical protein